MHNRWYDNHQQTLNALELFKSLDKQSRARLSTDIMDVAKQIKEMHKEEEEPQLSIGIERVFGLYQSFNSRRWYDKQRDLNSVMKTISTLPEDDFLNIMEGLCVSLNE